MAPPPFTLPLVATLYGISEDNLRSYEAEGLISPLRVGVDRYYNTKDRIRIEVILKGRNLGFSLQEIRRIIDAHPSAPAPSVLDKTLAAQQIARLEEEIAALQAAIVRLREG